MLLVHLVENFAPLGGCLENGAMSVFLAHDVRLERQLTTIAALRLLRNLQVDSLVCEVLTEVQSEVDLSLGDDDFVATWEHLEDDKVHRLGLRHAVFHEE